jgi:hypothetical protein
MMPSRSPYGPLTWTRYFWDQCFLDIITDLSEQVGWTCGDMRLDLGDYSIDTDAASEAVVSDGLGDSGTREAIGIEFLAQQIVELLPRTGNLQNHGKESGFPGRLKSSIIQAISQPERWTV